MITAHEEQLLQHVAYLSFNLGCPSRYQQLSQLLAQSIVMVRLSLIISFLYRANQLFQILSAFSGSFDEEKCKAMTVTLENPPFVWKDWLQVLSSAMESTSNQSLAKSFDMFLLSSLRQLSQDVDQRMGILGHCWISLCQFLMDLYVPDIPIDPQARLACTLDFQQTERALLSSQLELQIKLEERTSGRRSNGTIEYLRGMMEAVAISSSSRQESPIRTNVTRLHTYWSEINQFLNHVLGKGKIAGLLSSFSPGEISNHLREHVVQESITGFCQRLDSAYADFGDVNQPLQLAVYFMKFGLGLVCQQITYQSDSESSRLSSTIAASAFPTFYSAELFMQDGLSSDSPESVLLSISSLVYQISAGIDVHDAILDLHRLYEKALGLWLIDRARQESHEKDAQSLYRHKNLDHDGMREEELEEQEFLSMFPEFGDLLDDTAANGGATTKPSNLVDIPFSSQLYSLHGITFSNSPSDHSSMFKSLRQKRLSAVSESCWATLPASIDDTSLPLQYKLLYDQIQDIKAHSSAERSDFYLDSNLSEARKALRAIEALQARLNALVKEWPDQMVLHHISQRCEAILKLNFRSPLPRILSALEQLLLHTEDWETYAHRDNSIKSHQEALTSLIVQWRRLELASWQGLLESQARKFAEGVSEWWFRLYEATIHGAMKASVEEDLGESDAISLYLDGLVPLVQEFMDTTPLGQFDARLRLLDSMERFLLILSPQHDGRAVVALQRVSHILRSFRRHYEQFSPKVSASLQSQRTSLEKEIQGFIKLASWRDVNVQALRQSAQKSHRQLYKSIRKFREVLRQPVAALLSTEAVLASGEAPLEPAQHYNPGIDSELVVFPEYPEQDKLPPHLANLGRTFQNYRNIVQKGLVSIVRPSLPNIVDSLAVDIIATAESLSKETAPNDLPNSKRAKWYKNLLTRKRKTWSDMIKELRRAGLAANMKPEVLSLQCSDRWLREQPVIDQLGSLPLQKAEMYFHRLVSWLPGVRALTIDHHSDLDSREIKRALMLIESSFSIALESRTKYVL